MINAAGTMTALGASRVAPRVVAEIADILGRFALVEELQAEASAAIARATGAEAGLVTSSSAAGLTLACAASIAGDGLAAIEALPDASGRERRVAIQVGHMVHYGAPVAQAIALAGAEPVPLGTAALCEAFHLEAALRRGLAAAVYVISHHTVREGELPLDVFVELCRAHGVPSIVDMASEYELRRPAALGADAAIWSGHKFLAGPTSGIVAGRRAFVRAMYLQNRGIGRAMKVGKEGVRGAVAALAAWERRDHAAERAREEAIAAHWMTALSGLPGVVAALHDDWTGNPITRVELRLEPGMAGLHAWELAARLMRGDPVIALRDDLAEHQRLYLDPCNVTAEEGRAVAEAVAATLAQARAAGDGPGPDWSAVKRARGRVTVPWLEED